MRKLKSDLFGTVWRGEAGDREFVLRDTGGGRWWSAWLGGLPGTPRLLGADRRTLHREWIEDRPVPCSRAWMKTGKPACVFINAGSSAGPTAKAPGTVNSSIVKPWRSRTSTT